MMCSLVLEEKIAATLLTDHLYKALACKRIETFMDCQLEEGKFRKALADHEEKLKADHEKKLKYDMERVQGWRKALTQVGKISAFTSSRDK
ncbi:hypothetical protein CK203_089484 [Vitis vinifera]|uniref:Uncharacterized protein n=1 Tax=Vitis vinifera TaxID=29760 RepID=A0A438FJ32_VITVI|nr:hypothetical protein CK203_089484 [Vitis vinifera]